ncbi:MAG: hypothetical protein U9O94_10065 [Nanoarchaeota archaeon]|nr:hypothetical protein [Nanoarchaeota archaeon]
MDISKHVEEYQKIIKKYNLNSEKKAEEIAEFLTKDSGKNVSPKEFSKLFEMSEKEAEIFLSFIEKGIKFKEDNIDKR